MKLPTHLTSAGLICGGIWTVATIVRYYILWQDLDRLLSYSLIGLLIIATAYFYESKVRTDYRLGAIEDYLSDSTFNHGEKDKELGE